MFSIVKPLCVKLLNVQALEPPHGELKNKIQALTLYLGSLDKFDESLQQLVSYIELPLVTLVQHFSSLPASSPHIHFEQLSCASSSPTEDKALRIGSATVLELLFEGESALLSKIKIDTAHFERLFEFLLKILFKAEEQQIVLSSTGHLYLMRCVRALFVNHMSRTSTTLNVEPPTPDLTMLGFMTHKFLSLSLTSRNREVKEEALGTLYDVFDTIPSARDILAQFLPGLVSTLYKVVTGDFKQGHQVFASAFRLLSKALIISLNDKDNPGLVEEAKATEEDVLSSLRNMKNEDPEDSGERIFSKAWYSKATSYLEPALNNIFSSNTNNISAQVIQQWQTRFALVTCARKIATKCTLTLFNMLPCLTETLLMYTTDDYANVSTSAQKGVDYLLDLQSTYPTGSHSNRLSVSSKRHLALSIQMTKFWNSLENNLSNLIKKLPRIFRTAPDAKKLESTKLLNGYLSILEKGRVIALLPRLSLCLCSIFALDVSDLHRTVFANRLLLPGTVQARGQYNALMAELGAGNEYPKRVFENFKSPEVFKQLIWTCEILAQLGAQLKRNGEVDAHNTNSTASFDQFMAISCTQIQQSNECIFILNKMILRFNSKFGDNTLSLPLTLDQLLDFYFDDDLWKGLTKSPEVWEDDEDDDPAPKVEDSALVSLDTYNHTIMRWSLLLEGIEVIGKDIYPRITPRLYTLLGKLGDPSNYVSQSAWATLSRIASLVSPDYSVLSLVSDNVDFVVDSILYHFRYLGEYRESLNVLHGILQYCPLLLLIDDTLDEVLTGLDSGNGNVMFSFLIILQGFVSSTFRMLKEEEKEEEAEAQRKNRDKGEDIDTTETKTRTEPKYETSSAMFNRIFKKKIEKKLRMIQKRKERRKMSSEEVEAFFRRHLKKKEKEKVAREGGMVEEEESEEGEDMFPEFEESDESDTEAYVQLQHKKASIYDKLKTEDDETAQKYLNNEQELPNNKDKREYKALDNILSKLQHYISHKDVATKLLVLEILKTGLEAMAPNVGKFLPLVHTLWDPLRYRFFDQDERVSVRALDVMKVMAKFAREFISKKVSDDLWPVLKEKITRYEAEPVFNSGTKSRQVTTKYIRAGQYNNYQTQYTLSSASQNARDLAFKTSTAFKNQYSILSCLTVVSENVDINDATIRDIARKCTFYLEQKQPKELRAEAVNLYYVLIKRDPDFVWLLLQGLVGLSPDDVETPEGFVPPSIPKQVKGDFKETVKLLLQT